MEEKALLNKVERFITVLERGLNHYLDNWQQIQGKGNFPINSNEESYMAKNIIRDTKVMLVALEMTRTEEERGLIVESLQLFCSLMENNYKDFLMCIEKEIANKESRRRGFIEESLDTLFKKRY